MDLQSKEKIILTAINRKISDIPRYLPENFIKKTSDGKAYIEIEPQYETWYGMKNGVFTFIHPGKLFIGISNMLLNLPRPLVKLIVDLWAPCLCYCQEEAWSKGVRHYIICDKLLNECAYCGGDLDEKSFVASCYHSPRRYIV